MAAPNVIYCNFIFVESNDSLLAGEIIITLNLLSLPKQNKHCTKVVPNITLHKSYDFLKELINLKRFNGIIKQQRG